ncbi:MAG: N-acetylglucosamine-6-phosphate deacetylase [Propionibacteriaceae bacterium]|jgi:N-acetylglucosamine-6-phosphate deacetylase|nr:N-acetylglucosamine-6-phosphate deacetylase [Propionibacteriaceae bacterium]
MSTSTVITAKRMYAPSGMVDDGWVRVDGDTIAECGEGQPPSAPDLVIDGILAPGFVDVHSHGGGGASFDSSRDDALTVLDAHAQHGTTTMVASLVTAGLDDLADQVRTLAQLVDERRLAGIHLEGPWLASKYKGAHTESLLLDPTVADVQRILDASNQTVKMITIAPEKPGALEVITHLANLGVMAAVGHTAADYDCTLAAIAAGARGTTHLFNAMPDLLHRAPGPALALWRDPEVWVELVCDGVHVHPALVAQVMQTKPSRAVFITDAMAAAAHADGDYTLGGLPVEVRQGVARIAGTPTIAGSTLTLDRAIRTAVAAGIDLNLALRAATSNPADYLGLTGVGRIQPGSLADLVCLDPGLNVTGVMRRGSWLDA